MHNPAGEKQGPWPFVTRRLGRGTDGAVRAIQSRDLRKGLVRAVRAFAGLGATQTPQNSRLPAHLNGWIASLFAVGAFLFGLGSVLSLWPQLAKTWQISSAGVGMVFFAGSIPFTLAAYLQLFQSANTSGADLSDQSHPSAAPTRRVWFGWQPGAIGWLSCTLQFMGTLLFNVNTFDAMIPGLSWVRQDEAVWLPNFAGSALFLASGYLAWAETCHHYWGWRPRDLSWWITAINLLGCIAFMISACLAIALPHTLSLETTRLSVTFTLLGAIGFWLGAVLMLVEE